MERKTNNLTEYIEIYKDLIEVAAPFAITFAFGNLIVTSFLKAAFGGKVEF